jgi:hypothetical protein
MAAFLDACRFNPTAGGTTDWTYSSAVSGYQSPAAANVVNGRLYKYRAESADLSQWELGEGAYNTGTGVLARTTVLFNSSGSTSKINFSTVPQVAIVALKGDLISVEEANSFTTIQKSQARTNIGMADGHIPGEIGTGAAASGEIGEEGHVGGATAGNYSSGVAQNVLSFTVPSGGDWEIYGYNDFSGSGSTSTSDWNTLITSLSTPTVSSSGTFPPGTCHNRAPAGLDFALRQVIGPVKVSLSAATTFYMHGAVTIASGTVFTSAGYAKWRRAR